MVHVAPIGKEEVYTGLWWGILKERDHLEEPDVDGRIILRQVIQLLYQPLHIYKIYKIYTLKH